MNTRKMFILLFVVALLSACTDMIPESIQPAEPTEESATHANQVHWSYEGEEGPEHWGEISAGYAVCGTGKSQSPINIANAQAEDLANIAIHYQPSDLHISNNGHTVQVKYDPGSYIEVDGQRYNVDQFHYHAPSEHMVDGNSFAAELHIVHKNGNELAVIGILLEEGAENPAYQPFLSNLPSETSEETNKGVKINAADLLPSTQTTFRYSGSLTTPPCTEGVSWIVMKTPVQLSANQLASLENIFEGNNRPVQLLNERSLIEDTTP